MSEIVTIKAGDIKTVGNAKYIVTKVKKSGNGTVAFAGLKNKTIKKITIPNIVNSDGKIYKVTSITKKDFSNCKKLKNIRVKAVNIKSVGKNAFKGTSKKVKIYIPKKKSKACKKLFKGINTSIF